MNNIKRNMRRVFWLFFLLFAATAAYLCKIYFVDGGSLAASAYNTRLYVRDSGINRGGIYDRNGVTLAESVQADGNYLRSYGFGSALAHVVGYTGRGSAGLELYYNFELETLRWELFQRAENAITGTELTGNSIIITLDSGLQAMLAEGMSGKKGAVVALEPSSGAVLAMVSTPGFDPNTVVAEWDVVSNDTENSPLLNRAAQGAYPPGSIFKIITASAALEAQLADFEYTCAGEADFDGKVMHCLNSTAHGTVGLSEAMTHSCNIYFAALGLELGEEAVGAAAAGFLLNSRFGFELPYRAGSFTLAAGAEVSEQVETAIGQGKTLVTPLNMAMMAAAVANGGEIMKPFVVERVVDESGAVIETTAPESLGYAVSAEIAAALNGMLIEVVNSGTATNAAIANLQAAGKTGTAQNASGEAHSWFVGYVPADEPQIAFAILIENTGGGGRATNLAREMLEYYFNR